MLLLFSQQTERIQTMRTYTFARNYRVRPSIQFIYTNKNKSIGNKRVENIIAHIYSHRSIQYSTAQHTTTQQNITEYNTTPASAPMHIESNGRSESAMKA